MGSLSRRMLRAGMRGPSDRPQTARDILRSSHSTREPGVKGIFCDCQGTLFDYNFSKDEVLVSYLNAKHRAGEAVHLFTMNFNQVYDKVQALGLDREILMTLDEKKRCYGMHLEEWIDDDPTPLITASKIWHPRSPEFRRHMNDYLAAHPGLANSPAP